MIDNVYSALQLTGTNCRRTVRIDVSWQNARDAHVMAQNINWFSHNLDATNM